MIAAGFCMTYLSPLSIVFIWRIHYLNSYLGRDVHLSTYHSTHRLVRCPFRWASWKAGEIGGRHLFACKADPPILMRVGFGCVKGACGGRGELLWVDSPSLAPTPSPQGTRSMGSLLGVSDAITEVATC